jgi:hypothetical protein
LLRNSPAYAALSDDRDRQQLFSNYVEVRGVRRCCGASALHTRPPSHPPTLAVLSLLPQDLESAERERRRQERRAKLEAFSALLKMCTFITEESKWEDVRLVKPFSDDPAYIAVDEADRVQSFKVRQHGIMQYVASLVGHTPTCNCLPA